MVIKLFSLPVHPFLSLRVCCRSMDCVNALSLETAVLVCNDNEQTQSNIIEINLQFLSYLTLFYRKCPILNIPDCPIPLPVDPVQFENSAERSSTETWWQYPTNRRMILVGLTRYSCITYQVKRELLVQSCMLTEVGILNENHTGIFSCLPISYKSKKCK